MKTINFFAAVAAVVASLCFTSCKKTSDTGDNLGTYTCTPSVEVWSSEGSGVVLSKMKDAVIVVCNDKNILFRTSENDKLVIAAADAAYETYKNNANKTMDIYLVFRPANALGEDEKDPITVKTYHLTAAE